MAPLRSLLVLLILAGLICAATAVAEAPVEWYTDTGGGAVAGLIPEGSGAGGGAVAPVATTPPEVNLPPPTEVGSDDSPPARAAKAAAKAAAPSSSSSASARAAAADAPAAHAAAAAQAEPDGSSDGTVGALPFTGLELAVMVAAGLSLLLTGLALRPRPAGR